MFSEDIGKLKDKSVVPPDSTPKFCKYRNVPYSLEPLVTAELDRLEKTGITTKVEHSEWAAPIVNVMKPDRYKTLFTLFRKLMTYLPKCHVVCAFPRLI